MTSPDRRRGAAAPPMNPTAAAGPAPRHCSAGSPSVPTGAPKLSARSGGRTRSARARHARRAAGTPPPTATRPRPPHAPPQCHRHSNTPATYRRCCRAGGRRHLGPAQLSIHAAGRRHVVLRRHHPHHRDRLRRPNGHHRRRLRPTPPDELARFPKSFRSGVPTSGHRPSSTIRRFSRAGRNDSATQELMPCPLNASNGGTSPWPSADRRLRRGGALVQLRLSLRRPSG